MKYTVHVRTRTITVHSTPHVVEAESFTAARKLVEEALEKDDCDNIEMFDTYPVHEHVESIPSIYWPIERESRS